jgi:hypothetical protein
LRPKLYATELLKKLVTDKELKKLEIVWDDRLDLDRKIQQMLEE